MKKLQYIDYECKIGERVRWEDISGKKKFEGVIVEWKIEEVAVVKLDDGTIVEVKC